MSTINTRNKQIIFIAIILFIFTLTLRMWNIHEAGRWSDEEALVNKGYVVAELIRRGDLTNPFWYTQAAGHPLLSTYFYGLTSYKDLIKYDSNKSNDPFYSLWFDSSKSNDPLYSSVWKGERYFSVWEGGPIFYYDLKYSRFLSAFVSALAVVLVFIIGAYFFSIFTGFVSALILSMLPHFLGYSQMVTYESWVVLFFTACAFSYFHYLEKNRRYLLILTGILTGLTLQVKESTGVILVLYFGTYFIWRRLKKDKSISVSHLFYICLIGFITFVLTYPMMLLNISDYSTFVYDLWLKDQGLVPEVLFGRMMGTRFFYYVLALLITTPVVILFLVIGGLKVTYDKRKNWIYAALVIWLLAPLAMSLFHHRQHMVRYVIEICAPLSILAALGLEYFAGKISKNKIFKYYLLIPLFVYLLYILINITPYHLNYYNELVGGTKNVYDKKLFLLGWFGEGLKGPGEYVKQNAPKNSKIGLALNQGTGLYRVPTLKYELFNPENKYDYVIVNYFNVIRLGFDEAMLSKDYEVVFSEGVSGVDLSRVYKHK